MATYYLLNVIQVGLVLKHAGDLIDSTQEDTTAITAAGGLLVASSDAYVAAAAPKAQAIRSRGGDPMVATSIMLAAYAQSAANVSGGELPTTEAKETTVEHDSGDTVVLAASTLKRIVEVQCTCTETLTGGSTDPVASVGTSVDNELVLTEAQLAPTTGGGDITDVTSSSKVVLPANTALVMYMANGTGGSEAGAFTVLVTATPAT